MSGELSKLSPPAGATRPGKHKGRGSSSGNGKTAGRGHKGMKSRKSGNVRIGFEGGQMPMQRRLPKIGFVNIHARRIAEVRVDHLNRFEEGTLIDLELLRQAGLAKGRYDGVKIIGNGDLDVKVDVKVDKVTKGARAVIEAKGGKIELIPPKTKWARDGTRKMKRAAKKMEA